MPSVSKKQHRFMEAIAHSPDFARKAGVPQSVGKDFAAADRGRYAIGGGNSFGFSSSAIPYFARQEARQESIAGALEDRPQPAPKLPQPAALGEIGPQVVAGVGDPRQGFAGTEIMDKYTHTLPYGIKGAPFRGRQHTIPRPPRLSEKELDAKDGGRQMAAGGGLKNTSNHNGEVVHPGGLIDSAVPGRTDQHPVSVPSGAYVLPADVASAIGEGNPKAGANVISHMFLEDNPHGSRMGPNSFQNEAEHRHDIHGEDNVVPIVVAGGEIIINPWDVAFSPKLGGGDPSWPRQKKEQALKKGHEILDAVVKLVREEHISTLKKLPGPEK